jgi:hypothetical protein
MSNVVVQEVFIAYIMRMVSVIFNMNKRDKKMKCKRCGGNDWISYPVKDKQCKNCGHFQIEE